ncbi:MAG: glycosyl hydrolase family 28-related protein [Rikenellaceae bacterium]
MHNFTNKVKNLQQKRLIQRETTTLNQMNTTKIIFTIFVLLAVAQSCEATQSVDQDPTPDSDIQIEDQDSDDPEPEPEPDPEPDPYPGLDPAPDSPLEYANEGKLRTLIPFEAYSTREGYPVIEIEPMIVENSENVINFLEYGAVADGVSDDGALMEKAIEQLAKDENGGVLYVPKATYAISNVELKSNIHIHIEAGTTLKLPNDTEDHKMFIIGRYSFTNNVVVCGVNGRFTIDISSTTARPQIFVIKSTHNFMISGFDLYGNKIEYPIITMGMDKDKDPDIFGPTNGVVKDVTTYNSHYGYGLVQAQTARKVYFENLHGVGGATLRLETGDQTMNIAQFGGVFDVVGRNISCHMGNAAVMVAPHSMQCGVVQIEDIKGVNSGFAARIDGGYVSSSIAAGNPDVVDGTYADGSYVADIEGVFGMTAQVKSKHFKYMPTSLIPTGEATGDSGLYEECPSVACVLLDDINYTLDVLGDVVATGYLVPDIVTEEYSEE